MRIAIILGGGDGTRAGGSLPKQFQSLNGKPVLLHSVETFMPLADRIYLVLHPSFLEEWEAIVAPMGTVSVVCGGRTRFFSVKNALTMVADDGYAPDDLIAIHDGARPLVSPEMILTGYTLAAEKDAAIPAIPVTDSLRRMKADGASLAVERKEYMAVQTPQVFAADVLMSAYEQPFSEHFTDDASVVEADGTPVSIYPGDVRNIKITHPVDFRIAGVLME